MNIKYLKRAKTDIRQAFGWYEEKRRGLGFEFLNCVEAAIQNIIVMPEMYQKRYRHLHGCPIRRFPFSILYKIEKTQIVIHSIFDDRQNPDKRP